MPTISLARAAATLALILPAVACSTQAPAESAATGAGPPAKLGLCASCHNANGIAVLPAHPHIAGQDADYMRLALAKYRSGERNHPPMKAAVSALTDADLEAIVRYYAALPRDGGAP